MTIDQLRSAHRAEPFRPFVLKLADGRELPVYRREWIAMSPKGGIAVCQPDDSLTFTEISAVQDIKPLQEIAQSTAI